MTKIFRLIAIAFLTVAALAQIAPVQTESEKVTALTREVAQLRFANNQLVQRASGCEYQLAVKTQPEVQAAYQAEESKAAQKEADKNKPEPQKTAPKETAKNP